MDSTPRDKPIPPETGVARKLMSFEELFPLDELDAMEKTRDFTEDQVLRLIKAARWVGGCLNEAVAKNRKLEEEMRQLKDAIAYGRRTPGAGAREANKAAPMALPTWTCKACDCRNSIDNAKCYDCGRCNPALVARPAMLLAKRIDESIIRQALRTHVVDPLFAAMKIEEVVGTEKIDRPIEVSTTHENHLRPQYHGNNDAHFELVRVRPPTSRMTAVFEVDYIFPREIRILLGNDALVIDGNNGSGDGCMYLERWRTCVPLNTARCSAIEFLSSWRARVTIEGPTDGPREDGRLVFTSPATEMALQIPQPAGHSFGWRDPACVWNKFEFDFVADDGKSKEACRRKFNNGPPFSTGFLNMPGQLASGGMVKGGFENGPEAILPLCNCDATAAGPHIRGKVAACMAMPRMLPASIRAMRESEQRAVEDRMIDQALSLPKFLKFPLVCVDPNCEDPICSRQRPSEIQVAPNFACHHCDNRWFANDGWSLCPECKTRCHVAASTAPSTGPIIQMEQPTPAQRAEDHHFDWRMTEIRGAYERAAMVIQPPSWFPPQGPKRIRRD